MKIIRAKHMGWCFGVRDAVALVEREAMRGPVTVLGELVHNETVNARLRQRGVQIVRRLEEPASGTVVITAHGTSERSLAEVQQQAARVVEATCPLVRTAHDALRELVREGYYPVIIGQRDHVEVRGLTGDLTEFGVILSAEDLHQLPPRWQYGVVAQTTQPVERVNRLTELLRQRFYESEVRLVDTVCLPTKQRQAAAVELARQCDAVVVIGGRHSNNTRELAETCARHCRQVIRVETADELRAEWFAGKETVGITAGTSTPDVTIAAVERWLNTMAALPDRHVAAA
jgi:4-hydroxy-3-methylbut-2-enyl diphosphate reductase